jgi:hypothetical protein
VPGAERCSGENDDLVCLDADGAEVLRHPRFDVLLYGRSEALREILDMLKNEEP